MPELSIFNIWKGSDQSFEIILSTAGRLYTIVSTYHIIIVYVFQKVRKSMQPVSRYRHFWGVIFLWVKSGKMILGSFLLI